jgi:hypothetical protein
MKVRAILFALAALWLTACDFNSPATIPPRSTPFVGIPTAGPATRAPTAAPGTLAPILTFTPTSAARSTPAQTSPAGTPGPLFTPPPIVNPTRTGKGFDMRAVDWFKVLTTDPNLKYDPTVPTTPGLQLGPYVTLKSDANVIGYALIDKERILFMDMSGDGQEEAIISVFSGGTAGNLGLLIYGAANNAPALTASLPGYKIGGVADGDALKVIEPIYQGWEPNCCPSGFFVTRYRLQNNKLAQLSRDEQPLAEARKMTVEKFYELLQNKNYLDAYNFLSPAFRDANPFGAWSTGYANTLSFTAQTKDNPDGTVGVTLVSTDKTANGNVTRTFSGAWKLAWYSTARFKQWVLDSATFKEVQ